MLASRLSSHGGSLLDAARWARAHWTFLRGHIGWSASEHEQHRQEPSLPPQFSYVP